MKLRVIFISVFLLFTETLFSESKPPIKLDVDMKAYVIPTYNENVAGKKSKNEFRNCDSEITYSRKFSIESRGDITKINDFSFSWGFDFGGYYDLGIEPEDNHTIISISLGAGVYYNKWNKFSLTGPCLFLYPMYQLPVYYTGCSKECKPLWNWNVALDLGYNFTLFDVITVYPFYRNILSVNTKKIEYNYDFGVAVGLYFQDKNIKKWNF